MQPLQQGYLSGQLTIILNWNLQLQSDASDFSEQAAFSIGSGSAKVRK